VDRKWTPKRRQPVRCLCTPHRQWRNQLLRMFGPKLIRINYLINQLIKTARSVVSTSRGLFLRRQPRNFENITLVARLREHFRGFLAIFLVAQLSPKRSVKWRLLLLLLVKKQCSCFVWNSQGAVFYAHRSERLWFADCRHIFYFSTKKRHVKRKKQLAQII